MKKKGWWNSLFGSATWSGMIGCGESYFSALAINIFNATNSQISLLASFPKLIASLSELFSERITESLRSRKKVLLIGTLLQSLMWLPLIILPYYMRNSSFYVLLGIVTMYYVFGQFILPDWYSLISDLIPEKKRGRLFALRQRVNEMVLYLSMLIAGALLSYFSNMEPWLGFTIIFTLAFLFRLSSYYFIKKIEFPPLIIKRQDHFSFVDFLIHIRDSNYGRFVIYVSLFYFVTSIAAPFYAVFMLRDLGFTYAAYSLIISTKVLSRIIFFSYWGKRIDKYGSKTILWIGGLLIPFVPLFWLFSQNIIYLTLVELFAGFAWAGFMVAVTTYTMDAVKPEKRTQAIAYLNVVDGVLIFLGAMLGALFANIITFKWIFVSHLQFLFLITAILRLILTFTLLPKVSEKRKKKEYTGKKIFLKLTAIDPAYGFFEMFSMRSLHNFHHAEKVLIHVFESELKQIEHDVIESSENVVNSFGKARDSSGKVITSDATRLKNEFKHIRKNIKKVKRKYRKS